MAELTQYSFEDAQGAPDTYTTFHLGEAYERGRKYSLRVIEHTYEWADSTVLADYTERTVAP